MIEKSKKVYEKADDRIKRISHLTIYEFMVMAGCLLAAILMIIRVFYGTEITDEAYYISDAIAMVKGNIPYAYNNYSYGTGSAFMIIPLIFIYECIVPDNEGVLLFTRICFMVFWYAILALGYKILKKDFKKSSALLVTGIMISFAGGGSIFNFSYNTIPCALAYIGGLNIYDAIEHKSKYSTLKLILTGFFLGIAFLAHPGYMVTIAVFAVIILIRSKGLKRGFFNLFLCLVGGIIEMLVVIIPIILGADINTLIKGITNKLHPYPTNQTLTVTPGDKLSVIFETYKQYIPYMLVLFVFIFLFSLRYIREKDKKLSVKEYALLSLSISLFFLIAYFCRIQIHTNNRNVNWQLGLAGSIGIVALVLFLEFEQYPLLLYIGIYPVLLAFAQAVGINSSDSVIRFWVTVPALVVYLLILLERESELIRTIATDSAVICIFAMGINGYRYVYRDEHISQLDYKVESGVYKGIYTTEARANDLPELEKYLNDLVEKDEYYAFRDNVPAGYLMMHRGVMCDKATWDCLNYSYQKNAPANLYEFYQRRGAFPQKYIYVDFGRDENLSIEDEDFKFNEFINTYYTKTADFALNETFYHIMVYEYQGGFDGDFAYWIERHMLQED